MIADFLDEAVKIPPLPPLNHHGGRLALLNDLGVIDPTKSAPYRSRLLV
jgi:hypothetical protein